MEYEDLVASNPTTVKERIDNALEQLNNLSKSKRSRTEILSDLTNDLAEYYGYIHELAEFLLDLFPPAECVEYMEASDRPRPLVIRTNTLKTNRKELMEALNKRGASVEDVEWSKVAIKVTESSVPIGATPEYLAGHYMLQSAASLNPVMALAPLPCEKVLDMSAAPGGKTSYIAQLMKNSGTLIANDLKAQRQKATVANLHRLGVKNTIVCCYDGRKINTTMKGFDRVLLDAPCSGLGVISRDQSVKVQRTVKDIQRISHLQKELLRAAVDAVDPNSPTGGVIVYSTCSISTEENEQVVNFILQRRYVKLIDTGLEVGKPGFTRHKERRFHPSLALTRRFYPHVHNMDGFYVAKFKKYKNGIRGETDDDEDEEGGNDNTNSSNDNEEEEEDDDDDDDDDDSQEDDDDDEEDTEEEDNEERETEKKNKKKTPVVVVESKKIKDNRNKNIINSNNNIIKSNNNNNNNIANSNKAVATVVVEDKKISSKHTKEVSTSVNAAKSVDNKIIASTTNTTSTSSSINDIIENSSSNNNKIKTTTPLAKDTKITNPNSQSKQKHINKSSTTSTTTIQENSQIISNNKSSNIDDNNNDDEEESYFRDVLLDSNHKQHTPSHKRRRSIQELRLLLSNKK